MEIIETTLETALKLWGHIRIKEVLVSAGQGMGNAYWDRCHDKPFIIPPKNPDYAGGYKYLFRGNVKMRGANDDTPVRITLTDYAAQICELEKSMDEQHKLVQQHLNSKG